MKKNKLLLIMIGAVSAVLLSACARTSLDEKHSITVNYTSSADLNPNLFGQASPLLLTVYQLKNTDVFNQADYFTLQNDSATFLGKNLLNKESYLVAPGKNKGIEITINAETQYLAFVAAYSEIDTSIWRLTLPVNTKTNNIPIKLDKLSLSTGVEL